MTDIEISGEIAGASLLTERFGRWPSFHDAEIVELCLRRSEASTITAHIFRMTSEVSETGHYICDLHMLVTFVLEEITSVELCGFNHQNVISDLLIEKHGDEIKLTFGECYGLSGFVTAAKISVIFAEGIPSGSVYKKSDA